MAFEDLPDLRTALGHITRTAPGLITGGRRSLLWVIASYPHGCFIGEHELADQAGLKPDTVATYLRELTALDLILREQKWAHRGLQQCYRVNMKSVKTWIPDPDRVERATPFNTENVSAIKDTGDPYQLTGVTGSAMGVTGSAMGVASHTPIETIKSKETRKVKTDRFDSEVKNAFKVKSDRWTIISVDLDPHVKRKWTHSEESERLLDVIEERKGLKFLTHEIGQLNFSNSWNNTGLLLEHLRKLAGENKPVAKPAMVEYPPAKPLDGIDVNAWGRMGNPFG